MAKKKAAAKKTVKGTKKAKAEAREVDDAALKEYEKKFKAWEAIARKVLTGKKGVKKDVANKVLVARGLMEVAGGYEEACVILDAVMVAGATLEDE